MLKEMIKYLFVRNKWVLLPVIFALLFIGMLLVYVGGSSIAPFIYTLF